MNGLGHQRRVSYRLLLLILWATLLLFVVELTAGWISRSLCLLAESLHTLVDVFSTLLSLIAVSSPHRTLGKEIWGHGRGEAAGALLLSAMLGFAGISIVIMALSQVEVLVQALSLQSSYAQGAQGGVRAALPVAVTRSLIILIVVMVILVAAAVLAAAKQRKSLNSLALKLNVEHLMADAWLTGLVLLGLVAIANGYRWLDPLLAVGLVALLVKSLWQMLNKQLPMLLKPTAIAPEAIAQIACQIEGVTRCTRILSRGMVGRQVWIELHLALHPEFMVIASTIGERVERSLREHYGPVRAQIWLDQAYQDNAPNAAKPYQ
ncbi:MAG: cation transporter [Phormidesmis priestleyi]|uniref:Cation transporter n=1 Tax=Phormidesmis priestleyi TaxID=268141 RepID=A0A2W4XMH1_9CYAN|nr:MAG: cation transporter [Phormidesmis priestleyi]